MEVTYDDTPYGAIRCPSCQGVFLHHTRVKVYWRATENAEHGLEIQSDSQAVQVTTDMTDNPSRSRDGLEIHFWCETCHARPRLTLIQNKGSTQLQWVSRPEPPADSG